MRYVRPYIIVGLVLLLPLLSPGQVTITVDGRCNIFGAGTSTPPAPGGGGGGLSPARYDLPSNTKMVVFPLVTGEISCCSGSAGTFNGPDGAMSGSTALNPIGSISGIVHNYNTMFLVGVFLGPGLPSAPPPGLIFTDNTDFESISPELGQTFFVGNGRTGTEFGDLQRFMVPNGATRLYLGFTDALFSAQEAGYFDDNTGELRVRIAPISDLELSIDIDSCSGQADLALEHKVLIGSENFYEWFRDGEHIQDVTTRNFSTTESGNYRAAVTYSFNPGGFVTCDTAFVVDIPLGDISIEFITTVADCGTDNGTIAMEVSGNPGQITTSIDGGPHSTLMEYNGLSAGPHSLSVQIQDVCTVDTIIVIDQNECPIFIPNIFTPNGDGVNDLFKPELLPAFNGQIRSFSVYSRTGARVFHENAPAGTGFEWDGRAGNTYLNPGTYVYVIQIEFDNGKTRLLSGDVTLIR